MHTHQYQIQFLGRLDKPLSWKRGRQWRYRKSRPGNCFVVMNCLHHHGIFYVLGFFYHAGWHFRSVEVGNYLTINHWTSSSSKSLLLLLLSWSFRVWLVCIETPVDFLVRFKIQIVLFVVWRKQWSVQALNVWLSCCMCASRKTCCSCCSWRSYSCWLPTS